MFQRMSYADTLACYTEEHDEFASFDDDLEIEFPYDEQKYFILKE